MSRMPPRIARLFRFVVCVLALIGGVAVLTLATTATTVCGHRLSGPIEEPTAPLLIVLTAASPMDGMLSESSYWRSIYAIRAWRSGGFERILLSGEQSAAMKRFLVSEGVPSERVDLEENARSTRESALFTAALLRGRSGPPPVLMTSERVVVVVHQLHGARKARSHFGQTSACQRGDSGRVLIEEGVELDFGGWGRRHPKSILRQQRSLTVAALTPQIGRQSCSET